MTMFIANMLISHLRSKIKVGLLRITRNKRLVEAKLATTEAACIDYYLIENFAG